MTVGFVYDGFWPVEDFLDVAEIADQSGIDSIWLAEHFFYRDACQSAALAIPRTHKARIIPGPISPFTRHPVAIAMAAMSLAEAAGARFALHLGTGNLVAQKQFGVGSEHPLSAMEEGLDIIRGLCNGQVVSHSGETWKLDAVSMKFSIAERIPIYLAAIKPNMLGLANRKADGVVISAATSPAFVSYSLSKMGESFRPTSSSSFEKVCFIVGSVNDDRSIAYEQVRPMMAFMLRTPYLNKDWEMNDLQIDHASILKRIQANDLRGASTLISDQVITTLTASGNERDFEKRLEEYVSAGINLPVILPVGDRETKIRTLQLAIKILGS